jgi:hypothetical protein
VDVRRWKSDAPFDELIIYRNADESRENAAEHDPRGGSGDQPELGSLPIGANEDEPPNAGKQRDYNEYRHDDNEARVDDLLQLNQARGRQLRTRLSGSRQIAQQDAGV